MQAIEMKYCGEYKIGEFYEGAVKTNKTSSCYCGDLYC